MPISNPINAYLRQVEELLEQKNATEHSHRPALKILFEALKPDVQALNEPKHVACGAPDFLVTQRITSGTLILGYAETKDVGKDLNEIERSEQLKRYLSGLRNLILTDYLEFRWYVDGELRQSARLAAWNGTKLVKTKDGVAALEALLNDFLHHAPQPIATAEELAKRMARLTHLIRDVVVKAFLNEQASSTLLNIRQSFAKILIANLDQPEKTGEFADMFAQTLAYGLFSARIMDLSPDFSVTEAQRLIPKTNPFLRQFFFQITGPDLDDEPFNGYVNDLVSLLAHTDMHSVLAGFGKRTRQEDPVVHFYETFLAAYDPKLREMRGVYYTPLPVVSFIVRAVDELLKTRFNLPDGLADTATVSLPDTTPKAPKGAKKTFPKVLVLDPAVGTATFPYAVVDLIRNRFMERNNAGLWQSYVREQLLPRLFGFELLMAPYAVAHFKLALQLAGLDLPPEQRSAWAYPFSANERLNVFLTNTLEEPHEYTGLPLFTQFLADETKQANQVKQGLPVMVVLGNPPYSVASSNTGKWITDLVRESYYPNDDRKEANPKMLLDDYVKFIRWAQWRIEQTGSGILAFITNHGYLDNPTFRRMRQSLMNTFDEIYILDLHGNTKKKETAPDGSKDENVFDIQQGVAIGLFIKHTHSSGQKEVFHYGLFGSREQKYKFLDCENIGGISWKRVFPSTPFNLFRDYDISLLPEYQKGWLITDIYPLFSTGIKTHRDRFAFDMDRNALENRIVEFRNLSISDEQLQEKYNLSDTRDWKMHARRVSLSKKIDWRNSLLTCSYRPFDFQNIYYNEDVVELPRFEVMSNLISRRNLALSLCRQINVDGWKHVLVSRFLVESCFISNLSKECSYVFPLYINSEGKYNQSNIFESIIGDSGININRLFLERIQFKASAEEIFYYIYSILYSPTYRTRYADFLKIDFPRIPLTSDRALFQRLSELGGELVSLHLLESPRVNTFITSYPVPGDNRVEKGYPSYVAPMPDQPKGRVYINPSQYFEGVPEEVWQFHIGGYQVLDKWLKDRRGRLLTFDDLSHYQKVVVALQETIRLMAAIDAAIPAWPIE